MFESKKKLRKSGFLFGLIFNLIFFFLPLIIKGHFSFTSLILSILILLISIIFPYSLKIPLKYWINFGNFAAKLNSTLILALFFYVIIFPASLVRRFLKIFNSSKRKNLSSYYTNSDTKNSSKMKDQY